MSKVPLTRAVLVGMVLSGSVFAQGRRGDPLFDRPNPDVAAVVKLAAKAPPLPKPRGKVVAVRTAAELLDAVNNSPAGTTIVIAEGEYRLTERLVIRQNGLALVGGGEREKVILDRGGAKEDCVYVGGADDVVVAGLTIRNAEQGVAIKGEDDTQRTHVYNCVFQNIGQRMVKGTKPASLGEQPPSEAMQRRRPTGGSVRHCLFLNDRRKEQADDGYNGDYVGGIDMMWLKDWTISDNVFVGIRGRNGGGRGAVFIWIYSESVTVERNLFVNCDRGVSFGNPSGAPLHMTGGVIRNNVFVAGVGNPIELCRAEGTRVYNNTVLAQPANSGNAVRFYQGGKGNEFFNNIVAGQVNLEAADKNDHNLVGKYEGGFADPSIGDLRLVGRAASVVPKGRAVPELTDDFRGQKRNPTPDVGAHEVRPPTTAPADPPAPPKTGTAKE